MIQAGQVALFRFPQADLEAGKLRPALVLVRMPGDYDDWLICMISSQVRQQVIGFDDFVDEEDSDFAESGLKLPSVIRVGRLAVIQSDLLPGTIGAISAERLNRIRSRLATWLTEASGGQA